MKRFHFVQNFAIGLFLLILTGQVWALSPSVSEHEVNGFKVYLINTHTGNGVALTANIQAGSWNDEPVHFAGRAHLWEHVIHGGSKNYPGQKTLWSLLPRMGADYNAYTSNSRIFYHYYIHPDALPEAASVLGAMISEPEWNENTFIKEKETVKNEAKEFEGRDDRVLTNSIFINLLPPDHPLAMYDVGTQDQLNAMTLNNLKELYYSNYTPESLQIVVAGNFDPFLNGKAPLDEASILNLVRENFYPPATQKDPQSYTLPSTSRPLKEKIFPPIVSNEKNSNNFIELGTKNNQRNIELIFQAGNEWARNHPAALETLLDYLNLKNKGSLNDVFKKKGWATNTYFSTETINNLTFVQFYAALTEEGAKHRHEISSLLFANFEYLKKHGIPNEILDYLKLRNIESYSQEVTEADAAAELFAKKLVPGQAPLQALNFKEIYNAVTEDELKTAVSQAFDGEMIGGYIGPDVESKNLTKIFGRPQIQMRLAFGKNDRSLSQVNPDTDLAKGIVLPKINLDFVSTPITGSEGEPTIIKTETEGTSLVLQESHQVPKGGLIVELKLPRLSKHSAVAIAMFVSSFNEHFKSELGYLGSLGVGGLLSARSNRLDVSVSGNSAAVISTTKWLFNQLKEFTPSNEEVELARQKIKNSLEGSKQEFSASIAMAAMRPLLNQQNFSLKEITQELISFKVDDVQRLTRLKLNRSDLTLVMAGDYSQDGASNLLNYLIDLFPNRLTPYQRTQVAELTNKIRDQVGYWDKATGTKSDHAFGIARAYEGPRSLSREGAAIRVLGNSLDGAVFQLNRIEKELGYIHNFQVVPSEDTLKLTFIGQTEGEEKFPQIQEGWTELIERIKNKTLSKDGFESEKIGILRSQSLIPKKLSHLVDLVFTDYTFTGNPNATKELTEMVSSLQPDEIYNAGEKYLTSSNHLSVVNSAQKPPDACGPLLSNLRAAKAAMRK